MKTKLDELNSVINLQLDFEQIVSSINVLKTLKAQKEVIDYINKMMLTIKELPEEKEPALHDLKILSWNVNLLTTTSTKHIEKIVQLIKDNEISIFCLQEVKHDSKNKCEATKTFDVIQCLLNNKKPYSWKYECIHAGRGYQCIEYSATFYNSQNLKLLMSIDTKLDFARIPHCCHFIWNGTTKFSIVNFHIQGSKATKEIESFEKIYENIPNSSFFIFLGDFNVNPSHAGIQKLLFKNFTTHILEPKLSTMIKTDNKNDFMMLFNGDLDMKYKEIEITTDEITLANNNHISDHKPVAFGFNFKL